MKKWNTVLSRRTARLFLVVAWFLGLLLVTNGAFAQEHIVFSDDFDRPDSGTVGSGWQKVNRAGNNNSWEIKDGTLLYSNGSVWGDYSYLLRPVTEAVLDGKLQYTVSVSGTWMSPMYVPAVVARYTTDTAPYYVARVAPVNGQMRIGRMNIGVTNPANMQNLGMTLRGVLPATLKNELIIETLTTGTQLTLNAYNVSGVLLQTFTVIDTSATVPSTWQWGVTSYNNASFDSISLFSSDGTIDTGFSLVTSKVNVQVGLPITYTLSASSEQTITLSDTKGGIFSTTGIILNVSNNYTDSLTYIPTKAGSATITASGNDEVKTSQIFASPYATVIGYIGDSITQGVGGTPNAVQVATTQLGTGFTVVNRGVSGSTTKSRVNSQLADAITAFQSNGVEVVSIMLGTNDAQISNNISVNDYKTNVETIITQLKVAGIKKIILNEPPYLDIAKFSSNYNNDSLVKLREYSVMLEELADGETVIYGDTQTYEWFENHQWELGDWAHPNTLGHQHLGEFRAKATMSVLEYQINPNAEFTGINESGHTLWTTEVLTFRVDKYFGEFTDVVKVDNVQLATSDYEATSGSTTIELKADYLNTLAAGEHTLTVGFEGGVEVVGDFTILPDPTLPPITPPTTPTVPTSSWWGGGGISLAKDSCPNGDFSPSYYDKTCWTTANLTEEVAKKVNVLRPVIKLIYLTATEEQKTFVHNLITSCSQTNKNEVIKLACQDLVNNRDF